MLYKNSDACCLPIFHVKMFSLVVCEKTKILHYHNTAVNTISVGDKLFTKKQNFK